MAALANQIGRLEGPFHDLVLLIGECGGVPATPAVVSVCNRTVCGAAQGADGPTKGRLRKPERLGAIPLAVNGCSGGRP